MESFDKFGLFAADPDGNDEAPDLATPEELEAEEETEDDDEEADEDEDESDEDPPEV